MKLLKAIKEYIQSEWLNLKNNHRLKLLSIVILIMFYPITVPIIIMSFFFGCFFALLPGKREYDKSTYKAITQRSYFSTFFDKGNIAEYFTWKVLNSQMEPKKILINLYIPNVSHTTEIDSILINEHGIFVIESKGYSGWIFGNERHKYWTQVIYNRKNKFYNPTLQNRNHILALKRLLDINDNEIFRSYVVFSERCTLKNIKVFKPNIKIIQRNELNDTLNRDYELYGKVLNNEDIEKFNNRLLQYMFVNEKIKKEHINNIENFKKNNNF